ncbi:hypothetical protein NC652_014685 [Populus alba x Populus x berolinensis]|nr:hypothetical protein NC652_014685 [Populus alba x Populus x berolinensis]
MRGGKLEETEKNGFASSCREGSGQVECGDRCNFFRQFGYSIWNDVRIGGCIPPIVSLAYQNVVSVAKQSAEEENHWLRSGANCSELFSMPYF